MPVARHGSTRSVWVFSSLFLMLSSRVTVAQDVELKTEDNVRISATLTKPEGTGKRGALILIHELGGTKEGWAGFIASSVQAGYVVLAIDMRGHGKSENPFAKDREKKNINTWGKEEWRGVLKDIQAAKVYLVGRADVDPKKIVLVGASIGANLAIQFAADDPEIRAVAVLSPGVEYQKVNAMGAIEHCAKRPFFAAASEDDAYSCGSAKKLMAEAKHSIKNLRTYKTAGHGTKMFGKEDPPGDLTASLLYWLKAVTR